MAIFLHTTPNKQIGNGFANEHARVIKFDQFYCLMDWSNWKEVICWAWMASFDMINDGKKREKDKKETICYCVLWFFTYSFFLCLLGLINVLILRPQGS